MANVNFVDEFNCFQRYARNNQLSGRERLLWMALFAVANDRAIYNAQTRCFDWPEAYFPVPNGELTLHSTLDKRGIEAVRNSLKQRGLIDFQPGNKNKKPPCYKLLYLSLDVGYKMVPNGVPRDAPSMDSKKDIGCENAPNDDPNNVPNIDPNSVPKEGDFGCKNAPIYINNKYKYNPSGKEETNGGGDAGGTYAPCGETGENLGEKENECFRITRADGKQSYGMHQHIYLTAEDHARLVADFGETNVECMIIRMDRWMEETPEEQWPLGGHYEALRKKLWKENRDG